MTASRQSATATHHAAKQRRTLRASVGAAREALSDVVAHLDAATLDVDLAVELVEHFDKVARVAEAGKAIAGRRVALSNRWKRDGQRSPAHWIAKETGTTVGTAAATLETAATLEGLRATDEAVRAGELSVAQATQVAAAAAVDPRAEQGLLDAAADNDIAGLKEECARVKAAAVTDESARYRAQYRRRHLRTWTDHDGSGRGSWSLPPDRHARVVAALVPHERAAFDQARREGRDENPDAYRADALVALTTEHRRNAGAPGDSRNARARDVHARAASATIHIRVDHAALVRGRTQPGETCEIPGVGPVPVATARAELGDALLTAFVTDGRDVRSLVHLGRSVTADQRRALVERDRACVVPGCSVSEHLEIDHVTGWAATRETTLEDLARLCSWHHYLKTHHGYALTGPPANRRWRPPDKPPPDTRLPRPPHERRGAHAAPKRARGASL